MMSPNEVHGFWTNQFDQGLKLSYSLSADFFYCNMRKIWGFISEKSPNFRFGYHKSSALKLFP